MEEGGGGRTELQHVWGHCLGPSEELSAKVFSIEFILKAPEVARVQLDAVVGRQAF